MHLPMRRAHEPELPAGREIEIRDRKWIERVQTGDVSAFEEIFGEFSEPLRVFAYRYTGSRDVAEELVQDIFLNIWEHRHTWTVPGPVKPYLFRAARNRIANYFRHAHIERRFGEVLASGNLTGPRAVSDTDHRLYADELERVLGEALAELSERCRQVFTLNREQQLSYSEIADVLQISPKTVEIHMGRALTALRKRLAGFR
jgi:RNA polymerase sigma-19 factor, ECF subfamily